MDFRQWFAENSVYPTFQFDWDRWIVYATLNGCQYQFDKGSPYLFPRWQSWLAKDTNGKLAWKLWHELNGTALPKQPKQPKKPKPKIQKNFAF